MKDIIISDDIIYIGADDKDIEDLPDDCFCPLCGLGKEFFEKIEE